MSAYRLGIDIGGTFTDIVLLREADGTLATRKLLSTPKDYSEAIEIGVRALLSETRVDVRDIREVVHGTTVATNAIIERRGVKVALLTTRGFRDVLEIARFRAPRLYEVEFRKPEPLVERRLRFEVGERISATGEVVVPLDEAGVRAVAARCEEAGVDAIAVCFINAYVSPVHEVVAAEILRVALPGVPVTVSSELVPQIQEYERTSTTVVNAYIRPVIGRYVHRLAERLGGLGIDVPINIMQSNGGALPAGIAAVKPIFIIESGPAAGVVGVQRLGEKLGLSDAIVFDMGGTTAKAAIIVDGRYNLAPEVEVGGEAALGHRLIRGGGHVVQAPAIDIAEVGAGGGSIAWIDAGGGLQVGPRSAGADPGPACYGLGGEAATVTDANLLLGYINPGALVGGELAIDPGQAEKAVAGLAEALGQDLIGTAYGVHLIANARMMRALSAVSSERGLDPSVFPLMAFGGNGGVHVTGLAEALGIRRVLVPPAAGLFSALGLLFADVEHQCIRAHFARLNSLDLDNFNRVISELREEAETLLDDDGYAIEQRHIEASAEIKYESQNAALSVAIPVRQVGVTDLAALGEAFARKHLQTFGYRSDGEGLQLVTVKVIGRGLSAVPRVPEAVRLPARLKVYGGERRAYFGHEHGWLDTPVLDRHALVEQIRRGPLIIEEYDCTTLVRPGWTVSVDSWNNVVLDLDA